MILVTKCKYLLLLTILLFGCVAVQVPGETKADSVLKNTVIDQLKQWELNYHCSTLWLNVTDTKVTMPFDGKQAQEKWTVLSCNGEKHSYGVILAPSPSGGTDVGIRKWQE